MNIITPSHRNPLFYPIFKPNIINNNIIVNNNSNRKAFFLDNYNHTINKKKKNKNKKNPLLTIAISNPSISITCCSSPTTISASELDLDLEETPSTSQSLPRRLILLRHAHSSSADPSLRDHDRPLSEAGQADAVNVSQKLQRLGWLPQLILSSDALRTQQTLKIMQEQVRGLLEAEVHFISSFYSIAAMDGQTALHLQQAICKYSTDDILTVMCMGHNRGWEEAASVLAGASIELKTCNAALLEATGRSWQEAFDLAGPGGWKLHAIVKPNSSM